MKPQTAKNFRPTRSAAAQAGGQDARVPGKGKRRTAYGKRTSDFFFVHRELVNDVRHLSA